MCASNRNVNGTISVINDYISWDINNQINIIVVECKNVKYFLPMFLVLKSYCLIETVLLSTHNIYFG